MADNNNYYAAIGQAQLLDIVLHLSDIDLYDTEELKTYISKCIAAYPNYKDIPRPPRADLIL